ncbi:hypothetical protein [Rosistilla oblonga]|uniref:hypothetical protein n=1 Tax=Rosistilla oblonga TaxID=2527990 RepID=UPI003A96B599
MPITRWIGKAQAVAEVMQVKIVNAVPGNSYGFSIAGRVVSYTVVEATGATDADYAQQVVDGLADAIDSSSTPAISSLTPQAAFADGYPVLQVTGAADGRPIGAVAYSSSGDADSVQVQTAQQGTPAKNQVQSLKWPKVPTGGTFKLNVEGELTASVAYNAAAATLQTALASLPRIGSGNVTVTGSASGGYEITLPDSFPILGAETSLLEGAVSFRTSVDTEGGRVHRKTQITPPTSTIGESWYILDTEGNMSAPIPVGASAAAVQLQLERFTTIMSGNVIVTQSPASETESSYTAEFVGLFDANEATVELSVVRSPSDEPTATTELQAQVTTLANEVTMLHVDNTATGGTISLMVGSKTSLDIAVPIVNADAITTALDAIRKTAEDEPRFTAAETDGGFLITDHEPGDQPTLVVDNSDAMGGAANVKITTAKVDASNAIQFYRFRSTIQSGTYTITFGGDETANIQFDATAAAVQSALEALESIGADNVRVIGESGGPYYIEFIGDLAGASQDAITVDGSGLSTFSGASVTIETTTEGTGPNHFDNAANWSLGSVPVSGDILHFIEGSVPCLYGLEQPTITPSEVWVYRSYSGRIGLFDTYSGSPEWLPRSLRIGRVADGVDETKLMIGAGEEGEGTKLVRIDFGDQKYNAFVRRSGSANQDNLPGTILCGTHVDSELFINSGQIRLGDPSTESESLVGKVKVAPSGSNSGVSVATDARTTIGNLEQHGGSVYLRKPALNIDLRGGDCIVEGDGDANQISVRNASVSYRASGKIGLQGSITGVSLDSGVATITSPLHGLRDGDNIYFRSVGGMVGLDNEVAAVDVQDANTFVAHLDETVTGSFTSGGDWGKIGAVSIDTGGELSFAQDPRQRTAIAPISLLAEDARLIDPFGSITDLIIWTFESRFFADFGVAQEFRRFNMPPR